MAMKKPCLQGLLFLAAFGMLLAAGCSSIRPTDVVAHAPGLRLADEYTLVGSEHLVCAYPSEDDQGNINVVVEIPTGTNGKWEVDKHTGHLAWEFKDGKPRVVKYLGYPGNYGMIPRTLLPKELGGDGDPLDVLVLGPAVARGSVVTAQLIGLLKMVDGGEQDDKLIAVLRDSPLGEVKSIEEMDRQFPGVTQIVETWFANYKGPGKIETKGFGEIIEARRVLRAAMAAYAK